MLFQYILVYLVVFFGLFMTMFFLLTIRENRHNIQNPPPLKKLPFVSILVPAYNEGEHIAKTIESLKNLDYPGNLYEIIVIDDGSKDNTLSIARKFASKQVRVFTKENGGKASAINLGISKAKGEIIGVMDADSFVTRPALLRMIGYFADSKVMSVTPSMKVHNPKGIMQRIQAIEYLFGTLLRKVFSWLNAITVTPGPFSLFRKSFFEKHGGYDEHTLTEDMEIAFRIQSNHYKIENSINAEVFTVAPSSFRELLSQRLRWYSGFIHNVQKYSKMFHPEYGYIAMLTLPSAIISVMLLIWMVSYFSYLSINNLINTLINWHNINFDLLTMLTDLKIEYLYYKITGPLTTLLLITLIFHISLVLMAKSHSGGKEKIKLSYLYYAAMYSYIYAFWWIAAIVSRIFGKKIKWKDKYFD